LIYPGFPFLTPSLEMWLFGRLCGSVFAKPASVRIVVFNRTAYGCLPRRYSRDGSDSVAYASAFVRPASGLREHG